MSNTPTLMQSEERSLNELNSEPKKIKVDVTVSITMSKTTTIEISEGDEMMIINCSQHLILRSILLNRLELFLKNINIERVLIISKLNLMI